MTTKRNNKLFRILELFIFIISFYYFIFCAHSNSLKIKTVRKLESDSYKIFSTLVYLSYFIFIVMGIFILGIIQCAKGYQKSIFIYIYIANNGYLLLCAFTLLITGHRMVLISSSVSLGICFIGTISIIIINRNSIDQILYCNCLGELFQRMADVWELFLESIQKECSCFYDSNNYCMMAIHYLYTSILGIGLTISMILYIGFSLILIIFWCILKIIAESIIACCNCCKKSRTKEQNNVEINNKNDEINNNQQEKKILTINKQTKTLKQDKNNNSDIKDEVKSENETKKNLNNNFLNWKDEINEENNRRIDIHNDIKLKIIKSKRDGINKYNI